MKKLVLVLALLVVCSSAFAATQTAQMDIYEGWSFIGLPLVPVTASYPNVVEIFSASGLDIEYTGLMTKLDAPTQNTVYYEAWAAPDGTWSMLLGEGYLVNYAGIPASPTAVVYTGVEDGVPDAFGTMTDMWVSLPGDQLDNPTSTGGWHWISCPFNHAIPFNVVNDNWDGANIKVTDGNTVRTLVDAASVEPLWIQEPFTYLDGASGNWLYAGYMSGVYDDDSLRPGKAYKVKTLVDNLALIIPAYPTL